MPNKFHSTGGSIPFDPIKDFTHLRTCRNRQHPLVVNAKEPGAVSGVRRRREGMFPGKIVMDSSVKARSVILKPTHQAQAGGADRNHPRALSRVGAGDGIGSFGGLGEHDVRRHPRATRRCREGRLARGVGSAQACGLRAGVEYVTGHGRAVRDAMGHGILVLGSDGPDGLPTTSRGACRRPSCGRPSNGLPRASAAARIMDHTMPPRRLTAYIEAQVPVWKEAWFAYSGAADRDE